MQSTHSAEDQIRECRAYAVRQGWVVVIVERDEAVRAGAIAARDGYARLMKAAKQHEFDVLLVDEISRFSRDFLGGMVELRDFDKLGVRIADAKSGVLDLTTAAGQMQTAVSLMMSHQETQRLGERSKRGLRGKVLAKFSSGGRPAFGMRRVPVFSDTETDVDGRPKRIGVRIEPDPQSAHIVERIFREYCEGRSKRAIALKLNAEGVASRDAGSMHGGRKNQGTWSAASIKKIIENEVYVGDRAWNKHSRKGDKLPSGKKAMQPNPREQWELIEGYATPIVDRETWNRAQQRSAETLQEYARDGNAGKHTQYLLSGMIVCTSCGAKYVIGSVLKGVRHYRCSTHASRGRNACTNKSVVPQAALEAKVKSVLDTVAKDPEQLAALVRDHNDRVDQHNHEHNAEAKRLEARLDETRIALDRLVAAIEAGTASATVMAAIERRENEIKDLTSAIERARSQVQPRIEPYVQLDDFRTSSKSLFTGDLARDKALIAQAVEAVEVARDGAIAIRFRADSMFRLSTWETNNTTATQYEPSELSWLFALHAKLPGSPTRVVEEDGRVTLRNDAKNRFGVPSGI